ncbi:MAG: hypothetical protein IKO10_11165 [Lachnospiraceae bacterium]|nr:hypothetical protein [Lachnospiraceae bacterium]
MLLKMGLDPKSVNAAEIRADYEAMQACKADLEKKYKSAEKDAKDLQQKLSNVEQYVGHDLYRTQPDRQKEPKQSSQDDRENPDHPNKPSRS